MGEGAGPLHRQGGWLSLAAISPAVGLGAGLWPLRLTLGCGLRMLQLTRVGEVGMDMRATGTD